MLPKDKTRHKEYRKKLSVWASKKQIGTKNSNYNKFKVKFDYNILNELYIIQNKTMKEIGEMFGINSATVLNHLRRFNIKTRRTGYENASVETRKKMSIVQKGKKVSLETRKKQSKSLKLAHKEGRHRMWKGGITSQNRQQRTSLEYKLWRTSVF